LENIIERLVILKGGGRITPEDLPIKIQSSVNLSIPLHEGSVILPKTGMDLRKTLSDLEDSLIVQALTHTNGNKKQASILLRMNRTTLIEKMKKKGLSLSP